MIDAHEVAVSFGDRDVLDDVSLSVPGGRFVGLVGPNGAGKTTLLRTISGAITPDRGSVTVDGADVHDLPSKAASRSIAVVPQDTSLSFSFDVREVVSMGRTPHRGRFSPPTEADREHVERALDRTRTAQFADRPIDAVSGGERQRVLLARAVAQDAPVVLLDEPTASLDVSHAVETLELVRSLVDDGTTVLAAIHDLSLAGRFCDELAVLADGSIVDRGRPADVLTAETIGTAFDAEAVASVDPVTWSPTITAIGSRDRPSDLPDQVHVIGSGETAAAALTSLHGAGVSCSIGPVPDGDAAAVTARHLGVERFTVDPFESVSDRVTGLVADRLQTADATVLADPSPGSIPTDALHPERNDRFVLVNDHARAQASVGVTDGSGSRSALDDLPPAVRERTVTVGPDAVLEALARPSGEPTADAGPRPNDD